MVIYNKKTKKAVRLTAKDENGVDFLKDFFEVGVNPDFAEYNDDNQRFEMEPYIFENVIRAFEDMITTDRAEASASDEHWYAESKYKEEL